MMLETLLFTVVPVVNICRIERPMVSGHSQKLGYPIAKQYTAVMTLVGQMHSFILNCATLECLYWFLPQMKCLFLKIAWKS